MGCGACKWACTNNAIILRDIPTKGIRPFVDEKKCKKCGACVGVCPGKMLEHIEFPDEAIGELSDGWGPILEIYEGYAADDNIRYMGSSGGIATAIALYAIEKAGFSGILHTKVDSNCSIKNVPTYSISKDEIFEATGSRYAPASPCQDFDKIKQAEGVSLFIGKPCDCAALRKACDYDPELSNKIGLIVSIFCAGTPSTSGTTAILKEMGIEDPSLVESFRYRGNGWPGFATACGDISKFGKIKNTEVKIGEYGCRTMAYNHAWGKILTRHGQLRCRLCPDSTGEFADIAVGDAWHKDFQDDSGQSIVLIRTPKGKKFYRQDDFNKYVTLKNTELDSLPNAQSSVYNKRSMICGRLKVMMLFNLPIPIYQNMNLEKNWEMISLREKFNTYLGTLKRVLQKKWYRPEKI
jgi:coenzyme F420 hydrogenase subunit beta